MSRADLLAEKAAELRGLAGLRVAEITPSRRDFGQFVSTQRHGIALVPRLKRRDVLTGARWPAVDFALLARGFDAAEVPAVAVCTAALAGGSIDDLRAVADATGAPVLRDDLCLHPHHAYQARLHGADAVVIPAGDLAPPALRELAQVVRSLHMMAVVEVSDQATLQAALQQPAACVGLACTAVGGAADLERARGLAAAVPRQRTVLLLSEVPSLEALYGLDGFIDAAIVGTVLLDAPDPAALVAGGFLEPRSDV